MDSQNVTIRKKGIMMNESLDCTFTSSHSTHEYLRRSLPDLSTRDETNNALQEELLDLKIQLERAHNEIDNLLLENNTLKMQTVEQQKTIKQLKTICTSSPIKHKLNHSTPKGKNKASQKNHNVPSEANNSIDSLQDNCQVIEKIVAKRQQEHHIQSIDGAANLVTKTTQPRTEKPQINILGGSQCVGMSSALLSSRTNTKYQKYRISSLVKPHAPSEEILSTCAELDDSDENFVIMCIGENDNNPNKVMIELVSFLKRIKKTNVIILSVLNNKHLNEGMLNKLLRNICSYFDNCTFLNVNANKHFYSRKHCLIHTCKMLNYTIDNTYYTKTFLTHKQPAKNCTPIDKSSHKKNAEQEIKKGTIPYYFPLRKTKHITDDFFRV
ncbi:unnamed protein product [Spodoptera littoralis]|uniref:Uncharacterized protein n=1 Tax=Spodoptera littoralis TaxID=7109 RepID=A0A9P0N7E1_SPOLI|nr:unnamed protein product [Spodoptera littoralis]CAH1647860.1 unnamed protein product [Spodoptera littoralis]